MVAAIIRSADIQGTRFKKKIERRNTGTKRTGILIFHSFLTSVEASFFPW